MLESMFKRFKFEYFKNTRARLIGRIKNIRFKVFGGLILLVAVSFTAGVLGGILAINLNSDFFDWVRDNLTNASSIRSSVNSSSTDDEQTTIKAVNKILDS